MKSKNQIQYFNLKIGDIQYNDKNSMNGKV